MLPYLIAGVIGYGISKLFDDKKAPKYADGGLIAPNGKPSNLTPEQYKLVRTPAFISWFGDWENDSENASKVVDENGEPLVVYHGTRSDDFYEFENKLFGYRGFYFTDKKSVAKNYGSNIRQFFLNSKNFVSEDMKGGNYSDNEWIDDLVENSEMDNKDVHLLNFIDPLDPSSMERFPISNIYIIFNKSNIKLADGTNTTFDGNNPDIRFDNGGNVNDNDIRIENIYEKIPQPFKGIDIIGMGTWKDKKVPTIPYDIFSEGYDLPNKPILYIHSFFPKKEFTGKGYTKKYLLKTLYEWSNNKLENKDLVDLYGTRFLKEFKGSDLFGTSSLYKDGELFFDNLVENGYLEKVELNKKNFHSRALNLFKITEKTKNIFNHNIRFDGGGEIKVKKIKGELRYYNKGAYANINIVDKDEWHLSMIENQSGEKGMASKILLQIIKDARANNVKKISLSASYENKQIFYYNYGFKTISYGEYSGLYNMELDLSWKYAGKRFKADWDDDVYIHEEFDLGGTTMRKTKLLAPNGKPSNLTPEQYKLVRTPAFKQWFGDWENDPETASKVVDENGEPKVMYHSSDSEFTIFNPEQKSRWTNQRKEKAIWFGGNNKVSSYTYNGYLYEVFLCSFNPIIVDAKDYDSWNYYYDENNNKTYDIGRIKGRFITQAKEVNWDGTANNNDGILFLNAWDNVPLGVVCVVFEPEQIKLADGTNTKFDGENPDIRFMAGGIVPKTSKDENGNWSGTYSDIKFTLYNLSEGWSFKIKFYSPIMESEKTFFSDEDYEPFRTKKDALNSVIEKIIEINTYNEKFNKKRQSNNPDIRFMAGGNIDDVLDKMLQGEELSQEDKNKISLYQKHLFSGKNDNTFEYHRVSELNIADTNSEEHINKSQIVVQFESDQKIDVKYMLKKIALTLKKSNIDSVVGFGFKMLAYIGYFVKVNEYDIEKAMSVLKNIGFNVTINPYYNTLYFSNEIKDDIKFQKLSENPDIIILSNSEIYQKLNLTDAQSVTRLTKLLKNFGITSYFIMKNQITITDKSKINDLINYLNSKGYNAIRFKKRR